MVQLMRYLLLWICLQTEFIYFPFQAILSIDFKSLNVRSQLTVAMHQQTNRRVENRNKLIETYLRLYIIENSQWPTLLPIAEFVLNSQPLTSLDHKSSSEVDLGYVP